MLQGDTQQRSCAPRGVAALRPAAAACRRDAGQWGPSSAYHPQTVPKLLCSGRVYFFISTCSRERLREQMLSRTQHRGFDRPSSTGLLRPREVHHEILNVVFCGERRVLAAVVPAFSFARALFLLLSEYSVRKTHVTSASSLSLGSSKLNAIGLTQ